MNPEAIAKVFEVLVCFVRAFDQDGTAAGSR